MLKIISVILMSFMLASCASFYRNEPYYGDLPYVEGTPTTKMLLEYPLLDQPIMTIAVYSFPDRTGQRKPNANFSNLSTAVTQGSEVWLIQALKNVGDGKWFKVVERAGLDNLVKERQLIKSTREQYDGEKNNMNILKPIVFAGLIIEGGVVGYDSNFSSGGEGARYFGIGVHEEYRMDQVTISIRLISVQTGEILLSLSSSKTIASYKSGVDVFKFLDMGTKALEIEQGAAVNEPVNYAIRTAIEFGVLEMVKEGEKKGLWKTKKINKEESKEKINENIN
jgi:curli production assembly/transport component CsgG